MVFLTTSCVKETYDMNKFSNKIHLAPTLAFWAIKGNVSLSDMVTPGDTLVFDQNNLVKIIFKKDSIVNLSIFDFFNVKNIAGLKGNEKGFGQLVATIEPETLNFEIEDILSRITGDFFIANPSVKMYYSNSFPFAVKMKLDATGIRTGKTPVSLDRDTFALSFTNPPDQPDITDSITIDNINSSLNDLFSLPPEEIYFSGSAMLDTADIIGLKDSYLSTTGGILGSLEIEVPMDIRLNNIQFADTVDNFMKDDENSDDDSFSPEDFSLLQVSITAKNGFPLGVSLTMSLYDSLNKTIISTVDATDLLEPAPIDNSGKASGVSETKTNIELTEDFFNSINEADQIIFRFTLNSTDDGSKDVKIYSDYRIDFNTVVVMKPDLNINLK